jgi:hypothetical protein
MAYCAVESLVGYTDKWINPSHMQMDLSIVRLQKR